MSICNVFKPLKKPLGTYLTFSQYCNDITYFLSSGGKIKIMPSKWIACNLDYSLLSNSYGIDEGEQTLNKVYTKKSDSYDYKCNYNILIPKFFQDLYENPCSLSREKLKSEWNPSVSKNIFWRALLSTGLINYIPQTKTIKEFMAMGDIYMSSNTHLGGQAYNDFYINIDSDKHKELISVNVYNPDVITKKNNNLSYWGFEVSGGVNDWEKIIDKNNDLLNTYSTQPYKSFEERYIMDGINNFELNTQPEKNSDIISEISSSENMLSADSLNEKNKLVEEKILFWENLLTSHPKKDIKLYDYIRKIKSYGEKYKIEFDKYRVVASDDIIEGWKNVNITDNINVSLRGWKSNLSAEEDSEKENLTFLYTDTLDINYNDIKKSEDNSFTFNTIIVLYDIYIFNENNIKYLSKDIPGGVYLTGLFDDKGNCERPIEKIVYSEDILDRGTSYSVKISSNLVSRALYNTLVIPSNSENNNSSDLENVDINDKLNSIINNTTHILEKMNQIIDDKFNKLDFNKFIYSMIKNNNINTPYIKNINGANIWFINGKSTGVIAEGKDGGMTKLDIGLNGHWLLDGQDTGIIAGIKDTNDDISEHNKI